MKRKIIKATISILLAISITGCLILLAVFMTGRKDNYANKEALYKTDIIGEWSCPTEEGNHYLKFDGTICTYEQISGDYKYVEYTISELNDDIDLIEINSWQIDKFYNMLGNYYELDIEIPDSETFELNIEHWGIKYTFEDNGKLSVKYDEHMPSKNFNYYRKENIIFDKDTEKILFYIVKNGIFSPQYYKIE